MLATIKRRYRMSSAWAKPGRSCLTRRHAPSRRDATLAGDIDAFLHRSHMKLTCHFASLNSSVKSPSVASCIGYFDAVAIDLCLAAESNMEKEKTATFTYPLCHSTSKQTPSHRSLHPHPHSVHALPTNPL